MMFHNIGDANTVLITTIIYRGIASSVTPQDLYTKNKAMLVKWIGA
jgi:hypothetical protein